MATAEDRLRNIQFIDQREREYFSQAKLGQDVIDFMHSDVGRYLHGCAKQEVEAHRDALEKCNPDTIWGRRKIRRLQGKADAARNFMTWCAEAITAGEMAYHQLEEYRSEQ
jgi:hypothetical protein